MRCLVCDDKAHGIHHGVQSCRACAAFFRRSVLCKRPLECFNGSKNCSMNGSTMKRSMCPLCRYNKCLALGMVENNIQLNRDLHKSTAKPISSSHSCKNCVDETCPSGRFTNPRLGRVLDAELLQRLKDTFTNFDPSIASTSTSPMNCLEKMHTGRYRRHGSPQSFQFIHITELGPYFLDDMFRLSEWFMHNEEFSRLVLEDKLIIFRHRYRVIRSTSNILFSIETLGLEAVVNRRQQIVGEGVVLDFNDDNLDFSNISQGNDEATKRFLIAWVDRMNKMITDFVEKCEVSSIEWTFILCMLAFHTEALPICEKSQALMTSFRDKCSDDLHETYRKMNMTNYAQRLAKIFDFISVVEKVQIEYFRAVDMATVFDILSINIHSEKYE